MTALDILNTMEPAQVGDKVEATVLAESLRTPVSKPRLGSIKSNIGHLKRGWRSSNAKRRTLFIPQDLLHNRKRQLAKTRHPSR